ncbi:MAG: hypothetical protein K1W14_06710 [Muribaculaceae bacterium]
MRLMKFLCLLTMVVLPSLSFAQQFDIPVKFTAWYESNPNIIKGNQPEKRLISPVIISFDGKVLIVSDKNGKVLHQRNINRSIESDNGVNVKSYTLEHINEYGLTEYCILTITINGDKTITMVDIPMMEKDGFFLGYKRYINK